MATVFIVNEPMDPDPSNPGQLKRKKNLRPASAFGDLKFLLPAGHVPADPEALAAALRWGLRDAEDGDYLLPVGDIGACVLAGAIFAARTGARFRWLRWLNLERRYVAEDVPLFTEEDYDDDSR